MFCIELINELQEKIIFSSIQYIIDTSNLTRLSVDKANGRIGKKGVSLNKFLSLKNLYHIQY